MSALSSSVLCLLVALSLLAGASCQQLTNVIGTATCNFTTFQVSADHVGASQMTGSLTVNLTAGAYTQPNTPGFAGQTFLSYPIIAISGSHYSYNVTTSPSSVWNNITGIGGNRTLYMTFDPSTSLTGYDTDTTNGTNYVYRLDYTGITILTNSTVYPTVQFAEISNAASNQYSELQLWRTGNWLPASFNLVQCQANYTVVAPANTVSPTNTTTAATNGSSAVGDPAFTGFLGQRFQIHGMADTVYSIISDRMLQLNAQFVFLSAGQCPTVNGERLSNCWSHPGSYFGSLALQTAEGDRLLVSAGSYKAGFSVQLNGQSLAQSVSRPGLRVSIDHSFRMVVEAGLYRLRIENSDMFVNIAAVEVLDWQSLRDDVQPHGLLGQTWQRGRRGMPIDGTVDDYAEADNALFGSKFVHSKFGQ